MKNIFVVFTIVALSGCGVETATVAASAAVAKQKEIEQGKKTMDAAQQKIGQAMEQSQSAAKAADAADK